MLAAADGGSLKESTADLRLVKVKAEDSFEVAFNMACAALSAGDLAAADTLLQLAETRGQLTLTEEGASQEVR